MTSYPGSSFDYQVISKSTPWNVPFNRRRFCSNEANGKHQVAASGEPCSGCRLNVYCGDDCRLQDQSRHNARCLPYREQPVHEVVGIAKSEPNFCRSRELPRSLERHNILTFHIEAYDAMLAFYDQFFLRLRDEHRFRLKHFGTALFPKTLIILHTHEDCHRFCENLTTDAPKLGIPDLFSIARFVDEKANDAVRAKCLEEWQETDSELRILVTSRVNDDELVVQNLENLVVFGRELSQRYYYRMQRMARMSGQRGLYMTISPSLQLMVDQWRGLVQQNPAAWRPKSWDSLTQTFPLYKMFNAHLKDRGDLRLGDICDAIDGGILYVANGELYNIERSD